MPVVLLKEKKIIYFDGYHYKGTSASKFLLKYLEDEWYATNTTEPFQRDQWTFEKGVNPTQTDGFSCGVFILAFANAVSLNLPLDFNQEDIYVMRKRLVLKILDGNTSSAVLDGIGNAKTSTARKSRWGPVLSLPSSLSSAGEENTDENAMAVDEREGGRREKADDVEKKMSLAGYENEGDSAMDVDGKGGERREKADDIEEKEEESGNDDDVDSDVEYQKLKRTGRGRGRRRGRGRGRGGK
jgi:hypothetical protein